MGKKQIIAVALLVSLLGAGGIGYSWRQETANANTFSGGGYVHIADPEQTEKKIAFQGGTSWHKGLNDTVSFEDIQGNQAAVSAESFAHYDDQSLSALSDGVVVDLNDVQTAQVTNHYAVSPQITFEKTGDAYALGNTASDLTFSDFLWKVSENKYMLVSPMISVHFSDADVRETQEYLEVSYIEEGVVQLQTAENVWQTISDDCYATLDNGEKVNFSLRNVQNRGGDVLMDFSKITLNSESNIEVTPLTEELKNVKESVIPHFDITAEQGKDGEAGAIGVSGQSGESGKDGKTGESGTDGESGEAGTAGTNGAAGASGTNGAAGAPGAPGIEGAPGDSAEIEGTVLKFPTFVLKDWTVSATTCNATIMVSDPGEMLQPNGNGLESRVYLVDMESNTVHSEQAGVFDFSTGNLAGYEFEFTNLQPDHNYRLVVDAPINTGLDGAQTYMRNFISKSFYTDSVGVYMEAAASTVNSVSLQVSKQPYSTANVAVVKLYDSRANAQSGSGQIATQEAIDLSNGTVSVTFDTYRDTNSAESLRSNTTYFARVSVTSPQALTTTQILPLTTLKTRASLGAPSVTPNRENWGFSVTPGAVYDPDGGISSYTYEFYLDGDVLTSGAIRTGAQPVKTITTTSPDGLIVPLDGAILKVDTDYRVRTVASFFDNEKESQVVSGVSNTVRLTGSKLPIVYFTNATDNSGVPDSAAEMSAWYDQLYGTLVVAPGTEGARVLVDSSHYPTVTIRAEGYYYVQYPVYLEGSNDIPTDGSGYLLAEQDGGYLYIKLPNKALTAAAVTSNGGVNGLKPHIKYRMLLTGDLSNDGQNAFDTNVLVGSCVVETPDTVLVNADWVNFNDNPSTSNESLAVNTQLRFSARNTEDPATGANPTFNRQMATLSSLTVTMTAGGKNVIDPAVLGEVTLTQSDLTRDTNGDLSATSKVKLQKLGVDPEAAPATLGELMTSGDNNQGGIKVTENTFGLSNSQMQRYNMVTLTVSEVYDYTVEGSNRVNQQEYDSDYINEFKVDNASLEVSLGDRPGALEDSDIEVKAYDDNGDKEKDDHYDLTAKYDNSSKLARYITYYVFDNPDIVDSYSSAANKWEYPAGTRKFNVPGMVTTNLDVTQQEQLMTPFTTTDTNDKGLWLARVTIPVPANADNMPSVRFYPTTAEKHYGTDSQKLTDYRNATIDDAPYFDAAENSYVFFYEDSQTEEAKTKRGHQFFFAWTMVYEIEVSGTGTTPQTLSRVYPFAVVNDGNTSNSADLAYKGMARLHELVDRPRRLPTITALPWDTSAKDATAQTVTWGIWVDDPDGAVVQSAANSATLYKKQTKFSGTTLQNGTDPSATVQVPIHADGQTVTWNMMANGANQVVIGVGASDGSVPTALRVQRYTNKYTVGKEGIFLTNAAGQESSGSYTPETVQEYTGGGIATEGGVRKIPTYCDAFTFYRNTGVFPVPNVSNLRIALKEWTDGATVRGYDVSVTADSTNADMKNAAGIRMTFTADGIAPVVVDKYLEGADAATINTEGNMLTFRVNLANELYSLANTSNVSVTAKLLYETGEEGFGAVQDKTASLRTYQPVTGTQSIELKPKGWYSFNAQGRLENVNEEESAGSSTLPRFGSFFNLKWSEGSPVTSFTAESTRYAPVTPYSQSVSITPTAAAGASLGELSLVPRVLGVTGNITIQTGGAIGTGGKLNIPEIIPTIQYSSPSAGANTISVNYTLSDQSKRNMVYFRLEEITRNGTDVQVVQTWYCDPSTGKCSTTQGEPFLEYWQMDRTGNDTKNIVLSDLEPDQEYRLVGYYKKNDDSLVAMNFSTAQLSSVQNYQDFKTQVEPDVVLEPTKTKYTASNYNDKYVESQLKISGAENYYYTVELLDGDNFLTYLDIGTNGASVDLKFLLGLNRNTGALEAFKSLQKFDGVTCDSEGNYSLTGSGEPLYLNHGTTYTIVTRVYSRGTGPAHGGDKVNDDMIKPGSPNNAKRTATFTVRDDDDQFSVEGVYQMTADGSGDVLPTVTFLPTFVKNSATLRRMISAVVIVRERNDENGNIQTEDVTNLFIHDPGNSQLTDTVSLSGNKKFMLRQDESGQLIQTGDQYTCYVYAIRDKQGSSTEGYAVPTREDILQERTLNGTIPLGTEAIDLTDGSGTSLLIGKKTVKVTQTVTSAGEVSVSRDQERGLFLVNLSNPFNQSQIKFIGWSITANYTYENGENTENGSVTFGDYARNPMPITSMTQVNTNTYQVALAPSFEGIPDGAHVYSFTVNVEFYEADSNGDPSPTPVAASGVEGTSVATNGRVSQTIVVLDNPQATMMMSVMGLRSMSLEAPAVSEEATEEEQPEEGEEEETEEEEAEEEQPEEVEEEGTSQQPGEGEQPQSPQQPEVDGQPQPSQQPVEQPEQEPAEVPSQVEQSPVQDDNTSESVQSEA